jgi:murein DD-endopeptidase MepM/ murein hydrolase activator NlpD
MNHKKSLHFVVLGVMLGCFISIVQLPQTLTAGVDNIVLPADGNLGVNFISVGGPGDWTLCTGNFGLYSPASIPIFNNYLYYSKITVPIPFEGVFAQGAELIFYIETSGVCGNHTYLSTDPARAIVQKNNDYKWTISWEDKDDADFNDLVVEVFLTPAVEPFLELPYRYPDTSFIEEVSDYDLIGSGKVNSYFDHKYPTNFIFPDVNSNFPEVVTFHGYDSGLQSYMFKLAYDGHKGIDFAFSKFYTTDAEKENVDVLAAASGTAYIGAYDPNGFGKNIVVVHPNGYETLYGHLSQILISNGAPVNQGDVIGKLGNTGNSFGHHIHFGVYNPSGIVVDPFGWDPQVGTPYWNQTDPWVAYNNPLNKNAVSHYLWLHPLDWQKLNNPSGDTVVSSGDNLAITFPSNAYNAPYLIGLSYVLQSPNIVDPSMIPVSAFRVNATTQNDVPISVMNNPFTIQFDLAVAQKGLNTASDYRLFYWSESTERWDEVPFSNDTNSTAFTGTTKNLGLYAIVLKGEAIFLPIILTD